MQKPSLGVENYLQHITVWERNGYQDGSRVRTYHNEHKKRIIAELQQNESLKDDDRTP